MQAEEGKNEHDDYDQTDDVNYSIHDGTPGHEYMIAYGIHSHNNSALSKFLPKRLLSSEQTCFIVKNAALHIFGLGKQNQFDSVPRCDALARPL